MDDAVKLIAARISGRRRSQGRQESAQDSRRPKAPRRTGGQGEDRAKAETSAENEIRRRPSLRRRPQAPRSLRQEAEGSGARRQQQKRQARRHSPCRAKTRGAQMATRTMEARAGRAHKRRSARAKKIFFDLLNSSPGNIGKPRDRPSLRYQGLRSDRTKAHLQGDDCRRPDCGRQGGTCARRRCRRFGVIVDRAQDKNGDLVGKPLQWKEEDGAAAPYRPGHPRPYEGPASAWATTFWRA